MSKKNKYSHQPNVRAKIEDIYLKKQYGQHFLQDVAVVNEIISSVKLNSKSSVFEIGCGEGFLTKSILSQDIKRLWVFEIDPEWSCYVENKLKDDRLIVYNENFLDLDFSIFDKYKPWTLLANLPYVITFPILKRLKEHRDILREGIIMVQEEVAQKITATSGKSYGFISIYLQHFFEWKLLSKIKPEAFYPPPKVDSRLLYLKPKKDLDKIDQEPEFWKFIRRSFKSPRKMLKNNLSSYNYNLSKIPEDVLLLRAQQISKKEFLRIWSLINN